jgi:CHAT domain-containing protein
VHGDLDASLARAERGYWRFHLSNPNWSLQFRLLTAQVLVSKGQNDKALQLLAGLSAQSIGPAEKVRALTIEAVARTRQQQLYLADASLSRAEALCRGEEYDSCGAVYQARAIYQGAKGDFGGMRSSLLRAQEFALAHDDRFLDATAGVNLGYLEMQLDRYDDAIDRFHEAESSARAIGAEDLGETISGNLGWAYFNLGDAERALTLYRDAEQQAAKLGNLRQELAWIAATADVYRNLGDMSRAVDDDRRALAIARQLDSKEDVVSCLEDLAHISADMGRLKEADSYIAQLEPLVRSSGNRVDELYVDLARGKVAAARHEARKAESIFRMVQSATESQASMRLEAGHQLALLYEGEGNAKSAYQEYLKTLAEFEASRNKLKKEDSKLPFFSLASSLYDDYVHFLVAQGRTDEALAVADQSRARTLEQGLGIDSLLPRSSISRTVSLDATQTARRTNATLLFYWLGTRQSYLWAVTPAKASLFTLPPRTEITSLVERYRNELLGPEDTFASTAQDGAGLYRMLVAPAMDLIPSGSNVVVLSDGALSKLNFETLVVPGQPSHYLIEDATLTSAPSLRLLLASTERLQGSGNKLLLIGDAESPDPSYPELPMARREMTDIEARFPAADRKVLAEDSATPAAYLASQPSQFAYIHFVAHGTASSTDPLESAIILSPDDARPGADFKLYAREIMQHPIRARLVTVSACYGSGDRAYAGEGLVGLSWAFLRAGAHNVIGALWEVSDESTPRLMDKLYQGLAAGQSPAVALRNAKLALLHSGGSFKRPFYWAPFELYTGL